MADDPADELASLWQRVRDDLGASIPSSTFDLWIEPLRAVTARGSILYLSGPATVRSWVERRYAARIGDSLRRHSPSIDSI
ncbi:MAG TPA: DnaA N-terminal domain-containing protein, partial [Solirubrobacterales bacterium]|nr:DnaA N-terminal domain-containing protein [Solirubrobacterales bacterium]